MISKNYFRDIISVEHLFWRIDFFFEKRIRNTISVSKSLGPDQARYSVCKDCLTTEDIARLHQRHYFTWRVSYTIPNRAISAIETYS